MGRSPGQIEAEALTEHCSTGMFNKFVTVALGIVYGMWLRRKFEAEQMVGRRESWTYR